MQTNKSNGVKIVKLSAKQRSIADAGIKESEAEKERKKSKHKMFHQNLELDVGLKIAQMQGLNALGDFGFDNQKDFPKSLDLIRRLKWLQDQPKEYKVKITERISEVLKELDNERKIKIQSSSKKKTSRTSTKKTKKNG